MQKRMYRPIVLGLPVQSPDVRSDLKAANVSLVDTLADFSSQSNADASQENSKGDKIGGHSANHLLNPHLLVTTVGAHSAISGTVQDVGLSVWPPKAAIAPTSKKCLWQSEVPLGSSCSLPSLDTVRQSSGCQSVRQLQSGTSMQVACKPLSPVQLWASDDRVRLRPKKRKGAAACDLLPWHIEVARGPSKLQTVSCLAESEWVLASNRLSEKTEINHGVVSASSQATKRLRLTTQLLQQLIRPPPEAILSSDARLNGESVVFYVCRLALGDACSLTRDSHLDHLTSDKPLKKLKTSDSIDKQDFLITIENFNQRTKRLESDLLRLEKLPSIAETNVEIQDLEKFSVMNRFAKFRFGGRNIVSGDSGATRKPCLERYVVAHPIPEILPMETKCLSL